MRKPKFLNSFVLQLFVIYTIMLTEIWIYRAFACEFMKISRVLHNRSNQINDVLRTILFIYRHAGFHLNRFINRRRATFNSKELQFLINYARPIGMSIFPSTASTNTITNRNICHCMWMLVYNTHTHAHILHIVY